MAIAAIAISALAIVGLRSRLASHRPGAQLRGVIATQQTLLDQAAVRENKRDLALDKKLKTIARAKQYTTTPAEALAQIPELLPPLPEKVTVQLPPPAPDESESSAAITVPLQDLKPIEEYLHDCLACQAQLATTRADLEDERSKVAALTRERDAALRAARGGGFWHGVRTRAKWFVIGGAFGALAATTAHR
jgi:hypothetical protein